MIIIDLFDIDIHIFTVIKFLFNLVVKFKYIIWTAIIKTCAYNNRSALKLAFGEEYDKLYPGSIYSPPSYNENFSSSEG